MPVTIASDILDEARGTYLNDPSAGTYTNDKLLPHLKTACRMLEGALEEIGAPVKNEEVTKVIPAGDTEYFPLPPDLVIPRQCLERRSGSTDEFRPMEYRHNIPQVTPNSYLTYWTWRTDRLYFLEATQSMEVKILYQRAFPVINVATDVVYHNAAVTFLVAKVSALAYMFLAQSPTLASVADGVAKEELTSLIGLQIKIQQGQPIRRKPYMPHRR